MSVNHHRSSAISTVLVVEDEMIVRLLGADVLADAGFAVLEAGDADEALAVLAEHPEISLLFTDIRMPGSMDGLELASAVHRRDPTIRLLVTSADTFPNRQSIPDDGRFLPKPYDLNRMVSEVRALLSA